MVFVFSSARRLLPAALFVGALAGGGAVALQPGTAAMAQTQCPNSMTESIYIAGCLPGVDPAPEIVDQRGPDELPTIRGIPCAGSDCLGLSRALDDDPLPDPETSVGSEPGPNVGAGR